MRSNCTHAQTLDIDDLQNKSLRAICESMHLCEIKPSAVHGVGLFNASDHHIEEGTVFQVLSHGKLFDTNPVCLLDAVSCHHIRHACWMLCRATVHARTSADAG